MNYSDFTNSPLSLNDKLAIDRTVLAKERTHLAYMRTVISLTVAAITLLKLLGGFEGWLCAIILIVASVYFAVRGYLVCKAFDRDLSPITKSVHPIAKMSDCDTTVPNCDTKVSDCDTNVTGCDAPSAAPNDILPNA